MMVLQLLFTDKLGSPFINPLNPKIKIKILICCPYSFPTEVVGRSFLGRSRDKHTREFFEMNMH